MQSVFGPHDGIQQPIIGRESPLRQAVARGAYKTRQQTTDLENGS
jgi:hypothetical protein